MVLDRVDEEWTQRIREKVIHAGAQKAGTGDHPPFMPRVNGECHYFGRRRRTKSHEVCGEEAYGLECKQHYDQPSNKNGDGYALVVEDDVEE